MTQKAVGRTEIYTTRCSNALRVEPDSMGARYAPPSRMSVGNRPYGSCAVRGWFGIKVCNLRYTDYRESVSSTIWEDLLKLPGNAIEQQHKTYH